MLRRILTAVAVVAAAVALWVLAALFWALVGVGCILLAVIVVMVFGLRRRLAVRPAAASTWQAAVLREPSPQVTVIRLHVEPGADAAAILRQAGHGRELPRADQ